MPVIKGNNLQIKPPTNPLLEAGTGQKVPNNNSLGTFHNSSYGVNPNSQTSAIGASFVTEAVPFDPFESHSKINKKHNSAHQLTSAASNPSSKQVTNTASKIAPENLDPR